MKGPLALAVPYLNDRMFMRTFTGERGMRVAQLGRLPGWRGQRESRSAHRGHSKGCAMINMSFRAAFSGLFLVAAMALAATGPAQAESVMKQCGDQWKAAKANNATNGQTWPEFLKSCRTRTEATAAPTAAPAPAPAPTYQPAPAPTATYQPAARSDLSTQTHGAADRGRPVQQ